MATLVAYFSSTKNGNTARAAASLAKAAGADLVSIDPKKPYTAADMNWKDPNSRSTKEKNDPSIRPEITTAPVDITKYDKLYIGFPIWWGVAPNVVKTFLDANDFSGKQVYVFATSGGTGISAAVSDLKRTYPKLDIVKVKMANGGVSGDIFA